jgi:hypothetical protein
MAAIIKFNGYSYILQALMDEQLAETYNRLWKIVQHNPQNEYTYQRLVDISKLWYYKNKFNCGYSEKNEHLIDVFHKNTV